MFTKVLLDQYRRIFMKNYNNSCWYFYNLLYLSLFYISWNNIFYTLYTYIHIYKHIITLYQIVMNINQLWDNYLYKYFIMYWLLNTDIIGLKDWNFNNGYLVKNDPPITR